MQQPTASSIPLVLPMPDTDLELVPTRALRRQEPEASKEDFSVRPLQPLPPPMPPSRLPLQSLDSSLEIISIGEQVIQAQQFEASLVTQAIYRVPASLRDLDETAYTPRIISLGPYHHGRPLLREMDGHKQHALLHALACTGHDNSLYYNAARSLENRARACYEAALSISTNDFIESLVLDNIFVLELFCIVATGIQEPRLLP